MILIKAVKWNICTRRIVLLIHHISMSFPRRWESSLTISWIPFYKGMTKGGSSFPRRRESSITISWIPFYKGMTRGRAVIPTKVGIQYYYLLDTIICQYKN
ncbi:MAG: hypothetical protein SFT68_01730 [Rickettsiaceae bacterium]|nr:hypothetical protein [Rickettsiaceae bacterium]